MRLLREIKFHNTKDDSPKIYKLEEYLEKKIETTFPEDELLVPIPEKHRNIKQRKPEKKKSPRKNYKGPNRKKIRVSSEFKLVILIQPKVDKLDWESLNYLRMDSR